MNWMPLSVVPTLQYRLGDVSQAMLERVFAQMPQLTNLTVTSSRILHDITYMSAVAATKTTSADFCHLCNGVVETADN
jgi:hypothetical protein